MKIKLYTCFILSLLWHVRKKFLPHFSISTPQAMRVLFLADTFFWGGGAGGYFDSTIRSTTFLPYSSHFAGQISYPFDFNRWHNLLVEFHHKGRPVNAIFCQSQRQKFKSLCLCNIMTHALSTRPTNEQYYIAHSWGVKGWDNL